MELALLLLLPGLLGMLGGSDSDEAEDQETPVDPDEIAQLEQSEIGSFSLENINLMAAEYFPADEIEPEEGSESAFDRTGQFVSDQLFGTNAVYSIHTDSGDLTETFEHAIDTFDVDVFRFPAGEAEPEDEDLEGVNGIDITRLTEDGLLRPELVNFLEAIDGSVTLTIPTGHVSLDDYSQKIEEWTELVMTEYGDVVDAFEIGNEYWALMNEIEYGEKANIAIKALRNGIEAADTEDADILVQMASPFAESDYHSSVDDRDYRLRVVDANQAIIDQIDEQARSEIDGVVEHYYWNEAAEPFEDSSAEVNYIDLDLKVWQENLEQDLDLHITEWNLKASNLENNGVKSVSVLVEMVENMVELDVDAGAVWPIVHNTPNDLGGSSADGIVQTDEDGRVTHTVRGAIFDLMSNSLPGAELIRLDLESVHNDMEIAAYEKDGEFTIYIGNLSEMPENTVIDLTELLPNFDSANVVKIGYDRETSNGQLYSSALRGMTLADTVTIDDEPYRLNEHDTCAVLTDYDFSSPIFDVNLNPFEVLQITAR
jgi:hypothetical protein